MTNFGGYLISGYKIFRAQLTKYCRGCVPGVHDGVDTPGFVILGYIFLTDVVSCCIRHPSDAYSKHRLFKASVTVCLFKQHIAQYCGDSDNCIRVSKPHRAKE